MVDLSRDANGEITARLLDLVLGRSGPSYGRLDHQVAGAVPGRDQARRARPVPATPTPWATTCPTRCRSWTPSTSSSSAPRSSTRSAGASSSSSSAGAATRTTRCASSRRVAARGAAVLPVVRQWLDRRLYGACSVIAYIRSRSGTVAARDGSNSHDRRAASKVSSVAGSLLDVRGDGGCRLSLI